MKPEVKNIIIRYAVMLAGLFLMTAAVRITVSTGLGTSPLSTLPNVFACRFEWLSFGAITFVWNMLLIAAQIVILRRRFRIVQLMQIPLTFVFSAFLDMNEWLLSPLGTAGWPQYSMPARVGIVLAGCVLLGFSITLTVRADVVMNSGEAVVKAVSDVTGRDFGFIKIALDVLYVVSGAAISLAMFGEIRGVGVGTVICAVITGFIVRFFDRLLAPVFDRVLA